MAKKEKKQERKREEQKKKGETFLKQFRGNIDVFELTRFYREFDSLEYGTNETFFWHKKFF